MMQATWKYPKGAEQVLAERPGKLSLANVPSSDIAPTLLERFTGAEPSPFRMLNRGVSRQGRIA